MKKISISIILVICLIMGMLVFTACTDGFGQPRVVTNTVAVETTKPVQVEIQNDNIVAFYSSPSCEIYIQPQGQSQTRYDEISFYINGLIVAKRSATRNNDEEIEVIYICSCDDKIIIIKEIENENKNREN